MTPTNDTGGTLLPLRRPPVWESKVELTFTALGPARTRLSVEHRGWAPVLTTLADVRS